MTTLNTFARALTATALLSALAACAPAPQAPSAATTAESPAPATPASAPETRQLTVGEALDIELQGSPGTGYTWELVQDGAPVLRREQPAAAPPAETDAATPPVVGGPEMMRWRFVGAQPGKTTVHLVYRRPWEKDVAPVREARYEVDVR